MNVCPVCAASLSHHILYMGNLVPAYTMYHIFPCCQKKKEKRWPGKKKERKKKRVTAPIFKPTDDQEPDNFFGGRTNNFGFSNTFFTDLSGLDILSNITNVTKQKQCEHLPHSHYKTRGMVRGILYTIYPWLYNNRRDEGMKGGGGGGGGHLIILNHPSNSIYYNTCVCLTLNQSNWRASPTSFAL